jgi:hypothetical protein
MTVFETSDQKTNWNHIADKCTARKIKEITA